VTVADGSGVVSFDALALGTYSMHAFTRPAARDASTGCGS
jgi:hypothetical protein